MSGKCPYLGMRKCLRKVRRRESGMTRVQSIRRVRDTVKEVEKYFVYCMGFKLTYYSLTEVLQAIHCFTSAPCTLKAVLRANEAIFSCLAPCP